MILKNIERICAERGISIYALEKEANIGNGTIKRWDKSSPTVNSLQAVAKVLECTVDELLSESEPTTAGQEV